MTSPAATRRIMPFRSLSAKIMLIILVMGAVAATLGAVSSLVFTRTSKSMDSLVTDRLPVMTQSAELLTATDGAKNAVNAILLVVDDSGLNATRDRIETARARLAQAVAELPEELTKQISAEVDDATARLDQLI